MAFLQVTSTNPNFSFLLKKNPASGLIAKELRKGVLFGYYSKDGQTFNVYFRDAFNDISYPEYKDQEFEYVNATRYSSAQFILNTLAELMRDAFKKRNVELDPDAEYETTILMNMIHLDHRRTLTSFVQHFSDTCQIVADEVTPKYYKITITTKKSLCYLLNLTNLFAAFTVIRNKSEYLFIDETTVEKYFSSLAVIDPPYFIRYHFKTELLRSMRLFEQYKSMLETSDHYPISMYPGDTVEMRKTAIEENLKFSNHIVDVGCGEGRYVWAFAKRILKGKTYYAIDTNEDCRNTVAKKVRLKELTNVKVLPSIDTLVNTLNNEKMDFILGEVIEHMPVDDAKQLVIKCLSLGCMNSLIITTPNATFNKFYFDDKEVRHPDHHFEFSKEGFIEWVYNIREYFRTVMLMPAGLTINDLEVKFLDIGDKVDGIPVTVGAIFSRRT